MSPAKLVDFQFTIIAECPAKKRNVALTGPPRQFSDVTNPAVWNAPSVQLNGWGYDTEGGTAFNGLTLTIWHCPACGGQHDIEL